jgi:hypothetical protein
VRTLNVFAPAIVLDAVKSTLYHVLPAPVKLPATFNCDVVDVTVKPEPVPAFHAPEHVTVELFRVMVRVLELLLEKSPIEWVKFDPKSRVPLVSVNVPVIVKALESVHPPPEPLKVIAPPCVNPHQSIVHPVDVAENVIVPV